MPRHAPSQDTTQGDTIYEAVGYGQTRILDPQPVYSVLKKVMRYSSAAHMRFYHRLHVVPAYSSNA